jgi:hypothetical protein
MNGMDSWMDGIKKEQLASASPPHPFSEDMEAPITLLMDTEY